MRRLTKVRDMAAELPIHDPNVSRQQARRRFGDPASSAIRRVFNATFDSSDDGSSAAATQYECLGTLPRQLVRAVTRVGLAASL